MDIEFWEQRWSQNQTAFHLPTVNPYLKKYLYKFHIQKGNKVFIPLCGKSVDIAWLASEKFNILGVECSDIAIESFFQENQLTSEKIKQNEFNLYSSQNIEILQGDFFKLDENRLKDTMLVYDRASLIALPDQQRIEYVNFLNKILPETAEIFLITLEYDQSKMSGPPFSVNRKQVKQYYDSLYHIEVLNESDVLEGHQRFKERGLNYLIERVYQLTKNHKI